VAQVIPSKTIIKALVRCFDHRITGEDLEGAVRTTWRSGSMLMHSIGTISSQHLGFLWPPYVIG